ncbi:MAG: lipocalin family protein [Candidatus Cryptobacteroides sp.]
MKRVAMFLTMAMTILALASCGKEDGPAKTGSKDLAGDWQLKNVEFKTKSADIGDVTVDVYLRLSKDGNFGMWQQLGQGRYQSFSGTWTYRDGVLSGTYSDGKKWGSEYEASVEGDILTMTALPDGLDIYSYSRCTIPGSVTGQ